MHTVCVFVCNNFSYVVRLVHPDGSLADLTMLSASSVDAGLPKAEDERSEKQEEQGEWGTEKEKEQVLVVVMDNTDMTGVKPRHFSDARQSSTDESHHCSVGTEPEPSTEQSSGIEQLQHSTE